jgi:hypothetical protein
VVRCSDVSEECTDTASVCRAIELVSVDKEMPRTKVSFGFLVL